MAEIKKNSDIVLMIVRPASDRPQMQCKMIAGVEFLLYLL